MAYTYSPIVETWTLYGAGSLLIFSRSLCRWRMVGFRGFDFDDYFIWFSWVVYTVMTYAADVCDRHPDLHVLTLDQRMGMNMDEAAPYIWVTQWFCAGVATYVVFVWSLKINMLFFFRRVVKGLWVAKLIWPLMGLVVCTFIMIMGILFGACRPYPRMWRFYTDEGDLCEPQATLYMLPVLIMNITTDLCIMAIPAPVVLRAKMNVWKKVSLVLLFSGGFFIMIAAILRVTFVMVQKDGSTAAIWSCREDFVATLVGQAPMLRPAFSRLFWTSRGKMTTGQSSRPSKPGSMPINDSSNDAFEMRKGKRKVQDYNATILSTRGYDDDDSTERVYNKGIMVNRDVDIHYESGHHEFQGYGPEARDNGRYAAQ